MMHVFTDEETTSVGARTRDTYGLIPASRTTMSAALTALLQTI